MALRCGTIMASRKHLPPAGSLYLPEATWIFIAHQHAQHHMQLHTWQGPPHPHSFSTTLFTASGDVGAQAASRQALGCHAESRHAARRYRDVIMCCSALVWAMPEEGDDVYERFKGCRRPGTNRLIGGGWPLQALPTAAALGSTCLGHVHACGEDSYDAQCAWKQAA